MIITRSIYFIHTFTILCSYHLQTVLYYVTYYYITIYRCGNNLRGGDLLLMDGLHLPDLSYPGRVVTISAY